MAESMTLVAQSRSSSGSQAARRLRRQGLVPAVLYGHKEETVSLALNTTEFESAVRHGVRVLDLQIGAKLEKALIRDLQWDHIGKELLHADFERVAADERIVVTVPLEIRGIAPGVTAGGLLEQPLHTLSVECLAIAIPASIRVNINELQIGSVVHVRDLTLPPDVKVMTDPEAIVVQVSAPEAEVEAPTAPAAETAEPEVIGRKVTEEEEGE